MNHYEASKKIVGKRITVSRNGGKLLLKDALVTGIVPPRMDKKTWGIEYGSGNTMFGIREDDPIKIVG